jgi:hypothetical protein
MIINQASVNVGGTVLNVLTIEHLILRHSSSPQDNKQRYSGTTLSSSLTEIASDDDGLLRSYGLGYPEPNAIFALCRGSRSSPAVRAFLFTTSLYYTTVLLCYPTDRPDRHMHICICSCSCTPRRTCRTSWSAPRWSTSSRGCAWPGGGSWPCCPGCCTGTCATSPTTPRRCWSGCTPSCRGARSSAPSGGPLQQARRRGRAL